MKRSLLLGFAMLAVTSVASADTLWDQSAINDQVGGYFNSISGSPPFGLTTYTANDVTVGPAGWQVQSITVRFSGISATWGVGIAQGRITLEPKTGALPVGNPHINAFVPMTATFVSTGTANYWDVTASGLNLALIPGDYWIGITPTAPAGRFGPETQRAAAVQVGDATSSYDPFVAVPAWTVVASGRDGNILITGTHGLPTASESSTWGSIKRLYR